MKGFKEPTMPRNAPTGQRRLHQYLFSLRLRRVTATGTANSSSHHTIHIRVTLIMLLKCISPLDTIPMGQTAQNTGNLKTAEPTSADAIIPCAKTRLFYAVDITDNPDYSLLPSVSALSSAETSCSF